MESGKTKTAGWSNPICYGIFDDSGLLLRIMPNIRAVRNWVRKHFGPDGHRKFKPYFRRKDVLKEFDMQMQLGLTAVREIEDMLVYGGVAKNPPAGEQTVKSSV